VASCTEEEKKEEKRKGRTAEDSDAHHPKRDRRHYCAHTQESVDLRLSERGKKGDLFINPLVQLKKGGEIVLEETVLLLKGEGRGGGGEKKERRGGWECEFRPRMKERGVSLSSIIYSREEKRGGGEGKGDGSMHS